MQLAQIETNVVQHITVLVGWSANYWNNCYKNNTL